MTPSMFKKLASLGLSHDQMAGVLEVIEEQKAEAEKADEERKEKGRARWHKWAKSKREKRHTNVSKHEQTLANNSRARVVVSSSSEPNGSSEGEEKEKHVSDFSVFWSEYPHKVGKRDAEKAFSKARTRASFDAIMAGLRRYAAKTDDRPWCNPATFLNQDRWEDAPAQVQPQPRQGQPPRQEDSFKAAIRELSGSAQHERDRASQGHDNTGNGGTDWPGPGTVIDLLAIPGRR